MTDALPQWQSNIVPYDGHCGCLQWLGPVRYSKKGRLLLPVIASPVGRISMRLVVARHYGKVAEHENVRITMRCGLSLCLRLDHMKITPVSVFAPKSTAPRKRAYVECGLDSADESSVTALSNGGSSSSSDQSSSYMTPSEHSCDASGPKRARFDTDDVYPDNGEHGKD